MANLYGTDKADTIVGTNSIDNLVGFGGDDQLHGGNGDDALRGGTGSDRMWGGLGNDTYYLDSVGDVVAEGGNWGNDTVFSALYEYTLVNHIENLNLQLGSAAVKGYGNELNNVIGGNENNNSLDGRAGDDSLYGLGGKDFLFGGVGKDVLDGGSGNDTLIGGAGGDIYIVDSAQDLATEEFGFFEGNGTDVVRASVNYSLRTATGIENLELTNSAATGVGNGLNNSIVGNDNFNLLNGADGADRLSGGGGYDQLIGGNGNDTLNGAGNLRINIPEIDQLTGGSGADVFDVRFYRSGYANITDFHTRQDKILVFDRNISHYSFSRVFDRSGSSALDTNVYYKGNLIARVWDTNVSTANLIFTEVQTYPY